MAFCLGTLRIPPAEFWRMTPRELAALLGPSGARGAAPDRSAFEALMDRYPDLSTKETDHG